MTRYDKLVVIGIIRPMIYLHDVCTCELVFGHDPVFYSFLMGLQRVCEQRGPLVIFPLSLRQVRLRKEMAPLEFLLA